MAETMRLPIGRRVRDRRLEKGLGQGVLAAEVGISGPYLNLIEHDKRTIGGALLRRIAKALDTDIDHLTGAGEMALVQDIIDAARSLGLENLGLAGLDPSSVLRFVARDPEWAQAFRSLHRRYQDAAAASVALSDRLGQDPKLVELTHAVLNRVTAIKSLATILHEEGDIDETERSRFSEIISVESDVLGSNARDMIGLLEGGPDAPRAVTPKNEVDDFIIYSGNYFDDLEVAADQLRNKLTRGGPLETEKLTDALQWDWDQEIRIQDSPVGPQALRLDPQAPPSTHRFQLARRLAELDMQDAINNHLAQANLSSSEAQNLAARALSNYAAGALLAPYEMYLAAAEGHRYDLDQVSYQFGLSFEQAAHRLVTLRRRGSEGIPFAFLRADPAGNLSKPFSTQGLRVPRISGACPLWVLYGAFSQPDRAVAQLAVMPQGERYLFIARRIAKRMPSYGAPPTIFSVMLGCDAVYADRIVYGDGFAPGRTSLETPTGYSCASCARLDCPQRATPYILG